MCMHMCMSNIVVVCNFPYHSSLIFNLNIEVLSQSIRCQNRQKCLSYNNRHITIIFQLSINKQLSQSHLLVSRNLPDIRPDHLGLLPSTPNLSTIECKGNRLSLLQQHVDFFGDFLRRDWGCGWRCSVFQCQRFKDIVAGWSYFW